MNRMNSFLLLLCLVLFQGCAAKKTTPPDPDAMSAQEACAEEPAQPDAAESLNRAIFTFNDGVITYVFTPINTVYTGFFPPDMRQGFGNFYRNLGYPVRLTNALLQFKFDKMAKETGAFLMNTVFGVGGLFNITRNMPALQSSPEDFGQTLAFYGLGHGSYLVLPLLGPSSVRDTVGSVADSLLSPLAWLQPDSAKYALMGHDKGNTASAALPAYQALKQDSFDHYSSVRDVYFQHRTSLEAK